MDMAKRSSMFDDPAVEIQELTALIKNDITALNSAVSDLQTVQKLEVADGSCSNDTNLKAHENRKQIFSTGMSRENAFLHQSKAVTEPPPWSNTFNSAGNLPPSV
ncbi:syntaxin [Asimina triloba]